MDGEEKADRDPTAGSDETEARLPWTPSPNKVCSIATLGVLPFFERSNGTRVICWDTWYDIVTLHEEQRITS